MITYSVANAPIMHNESTVFADPNAAAEHMVRLREAGGRPLVTTTVEGLKYPLVSGVSEDPVPHFSHSAYDATRPARTVIVEAERVLYAVLDQTGRRPAISHIPARYQVTAQPTRFNESFSSFDPEEAAQRAVELRARGEVVTVQAYIIGDRRRVNTHLSSSGQISHVPTEGTNTVPRVLAALAEPVMRRILALEAARGAAV